MGFLSHSTITVLNYYNYVQLSVADTGFGVLEGRRISSLGGAKVICCQNSPRRLHREKLGPGGVTLDPRVQHILPKFATSMVMD